MNELSRQINVLNLLLAATVIVVGMMLIVPLFSDETSLPSFAPPAVVEKKVEPVPESQTPQLQDYAVISGKNLFHPGRIVPAQKKDEVIQRPDFILYGTLISDTVSIAYLSDIKTPRSTPGRGKRQTGLKLGEIMSGYTLKEVQPDRVIMVRGDDRMEIKVIAPGGKNRGYDGPAPPASPAVTPQTSRPATGNIIPATPDGPRAPVTRSLRSRQNLRP